MKKQFIIIGSICLLICVEISGCNQISNVFLTDQDRLVGTWDTEGIWLEGRTVIMFSPNGTFKAEIELGIPLSVNLSLSKGKWNMNNQILAMEIVNMIPRTNYSYKFSEDNKTLTLTETNSNNSYILRKQ